MCQQTDVTHQIGSIKRGRGLTNFQSRAAVPPTSFLTTMYSSATFPALDYTSPSMAPISPIRYDDKGRQVDYVESALQRQERVAFIRKREWARRMSAWIQQSQFVNEHYNRDVLYDSAMVRDSLSVFRCIFLTWSTERCIVQTQSNMGFRFYSRGTRGI
jgi:hypothetical protein